MQKMTELTLACQSNSFSYVPWPTSISNLISHNKMPLPYIYAMLYLPLKPSIHWHFISTITLQERLHRPLSQMRKQTSSNKCEVKTNESLCHSLLRTLLKVNWSILLTYLTTFLFQKMWAPQC